jgi:DNA polymerase-3 subunit delta'
LIADVAGGTGFSGLLGQEKAKKLIRRALTSERMPHALLFRGPDGVGKQLFARGMAAAINCRGGDRGEACGTCPSCRKFRSGNHPDFLVISPDRGAIKIEQIRRLCQALSYPPYESETRVVLLEDVHGMRAEAANSLLKTLEEPPADNLLILTADSSREVLPTITSRCQVVPFYNLDQHDTVQILLAKEDGLDRETAELLARLSEGSPGRARLLLKTEMVAVMKKVVAVISDPALDADRDAGTLLQAAAIMAELKDNLPPLLGLLRIWLRDQLMRACRLPKGMGESADTVDREVGGVTNWETDRLFAQLQAINRAEQELARNCNRTLVCEVLLFKL